MSAGSYIRNIPKTQMRRYVSAWDGLPLPRLQLRWAPKPVPASDPKRRKDIAMSKGISRSMGYPYKPDLAWDCHYELVLPVDKYDIRNEHYGAGFIIVPISWTRRGCQQTPCTDSPIDDPYRDGSHAYWDSKALGWLPIFVVAPNGAAAMKATYRDQPPEWPELASAMSAGTAETEGLRAKPASAVPKGQTPNPPPNPQGNPNAQ